MQYNVAAASRHSPAMYHVWPAAVVPPPAKIQARPKMTSSPR